MIELPKPERGCPFCGAGADQCHVENVCQMGSGQDAWTVICEQCGANGPLDFTKPNSPGQAVYEWGVRADV